MPLKVVGAGLGRTGTVSLKYALERLLGGRCYHMSECFTTDHGPRLWTAASEGKPDWEAIFDGFNATVDYPACAFWRPLSQYYPDAKILLSVRDADKWFDSTQATIFSDTSRKLFVDTAPPHVKTFFEKCVFGHFGDRIHDRTFMTEYFKRHVAEVEQTIPRNRLLVFDVAQGWEPLCAFLGVPVPDEPFPRANSRDELAGAFAAAAAEQENGGSLERFQAHANQINKKN